ncbi:TonB-dependent receptor [Parasphingorhabdus cellanae]|uniref:TonB-dependent receptor n=1 Tax=Parasphingorhabdus cellanae TaxID=2806553 RepID=A0ABX7SZZ2_9SPHN|nr:TonB-dependent receptor [Parasphingorhabdus cellanae]QTD54461.1 TonB-dependent receptor [Parasphingorhabdus cellanae]
MKKSFLFGSSAAMLICTPCLAQESLPLDEADGQNREIVVTAQKIERSLQDTKESIAVVTSDTIEAQNLLDIEDVLNLTANAFEFAGGENFGIRGVTQNSASTGGGSGELASLYVDGVALTGFATRFLPKDLWDVSSVEVLRGPQSTNVGRNALVGALVVTTSRANPDQFEAAARLEYGNYNKLSTSALINVPLGDNAAFRLSGEYEETDGFITNITIPVENFDARENVNLRGKLFFEPADGLTIDVTGQYARTERGQDIFRGDLQPDNSRVSTANLRAFEEYEGYTASLDINYDLSENWAIRSVTAYLEGDYERFDDDDEGPEGGNANRGRIASDQNWSQEVRFTYQSDRLNGVFGGYYTEVKIDNLTQGLVNILPSQVGVPAALLPFYPALIEVQADVPFEGDTRNYAFFTEWDFEFTDNWIVSGGLRYENERQNNLSNTNNSLAPGSELPDPAAAGALADMLQPGSGPFVQAGVTQINARLAAQLAPTNFPATVTTYDALLPQFGLTHRVSDAVSVSAFYKRGYRAGGSEVNLAGVQSDFDPEFLDNFELSLRSELIPNQLFLNANIYYGDWSSQQVTICQNGSVTNCTVENAGESEIYGGELELSYRPSKRTTLFANLGVSKTKFTNFISGTEGDLTGNIFAFSPDFNISFGGRHFFTDNFYLAGNVSHQSDSFSSVQNDVSLDDRTLVDLSAGYDADRFGIKLYVSNLFDKDYLTNDGRNGLTDARFVRLGAPREYGLVLTARY